MKRYYALLLLTSLNVVAMDVDNGATTETSASVGTSGEISLRTEYRGSLDGMEELFYQARSIDQFFPDIMAENTRTLNQIEFERKDFKQFMETEKAKLEDKKNAVADLQKKAQELHESSIDRLNQAVAKENDLKTAQAQHVANVKSLGEREADLKKERADLDEYKKKTDALAAETQAKMEKLKQFIS